MDLGNAIRKIRQSKGLSQGEMQKRTGILRSYLSRVENGHTIPSLATLQRLATAMDVRLADFFSPDGGVIAEPQLSDTATEYLGELKGYLPNLSAEQKQELLDMVKEMSTALRRT
jgi:transcriptional regulator with XRE-family HTH domain